MADFTALKTTIQTYIKQNGNEEITGNILQEVLLAMVQTMGDGAINDLVTDLSDEVTARQNADTTLGNSLQAIHDAIDNGYVYAGIATPTGTPVSGKVFYLAVTAGTYTNFGGLTVTQGINILKYNGSSWSVEQVVGIDDVPTAGSENLVKSGGVYNRVCRIGDSSNLLDSAEYYQGYYYNIQAIENSRYSYFILDVISGVTYYISPGFRFLSKENTILVGETLVPYSYTADFTGKLYITFDKQNPGWIVSTNQDNSNIRPFDIPSIYHFSIKQSIGTNKKLPMSQDATTNAIFENTGSSLKNLFELAEYVEGYYYNKGAFTNDNYIYFIIPVISGTTYKIGPRVRFLCKENQTKFVDEQTAPYTYTADFTGNLYVTMFICDKCWKMTISTDYDKTEAYKPTLMFVDRFKGKKILNIGDSIAENRSDSRNYANQFADRTGAILDTDYAVGGSTLSLVQNQGARGCVYSQALRAINAHQERDYYDIIMIDGVANDHTQNRSIGSIVGTIGQYEISDYTATFDETTVIGAVEAIFQSLRNHFTPSIIVFILPHKHDRTGQVWEQMLDGIRNACDKWSIALLDMDRDGELNARVSAMRTFTDAGGTHPNTEGIRRFYLPKLIQKLSSFF